MRPLMLINPNDTHPSQMVRIVINQLMGLIQGQLATQIPPDTQRFRHRTHRHPVYG